MGLSETGGNISETARRCYASRNSVWLWKGRYAEGGETELVPLAHGREEWKASACALAKRNELIRT